MSAKYRDLLFRLLPGGKLFFRDSKSGISKLLSALGAELQRVESRAMALHAEADPRTALETLERWESVLNVTASENDSDRQKQITAVFASYGGQTSAYIVEAAAAIGLTVSVVEYPTFTAPDANADPLRTIYCFQVIAPDTSTITLRVGMQCGQPLRRFGVGSPIPALIERIKPAHTQAYIAYI